MEMDLDVHLLRVHVLQPLFGREAHHGRHEPVALAAPHDDADALARLVPVAVPLRAGVRRPPERLRHQVGVDVDGTQGQRSVGVMSRRNGRTVDTSHS